MQNLAGDRIDKADCIDLITKKLDPNHPIFIGGDDFEHITLEAKATPNQFEIIALVLNTGQFAQKLALVETLTDSKGDRRIEVGFGNAKTINATDRGNDNDITSFKQ